MTSAFDLSVFLVLAVALPFAASLLISLFGPRLRVPPGWLTLAAAAGSVVVLVLLAARATVPPRLALAWLPAIDVAFALRADGFGLFFALLVAGVGVLIVLYSLAYMADEAPDRMRRYYAAFSGFMGAMIGIALADDLILLFVFWEITSVTSFLLIGFRSQDDAARAGAQTALLVTALGGLVMSVGFLLVGQVAGTFSVSAIVADPQRIATLLASPLANAALLLILCGAFTKSAQVPFHFWLPRAMVAPTPVSAYLHAATMVKAGVFLVGRILPIFGSMPLWTPLVATVGAATMLLGAYQALWETDLKAILARTTASALGMMMLLYGLGAADQDALQMLNHALYKGSLFLIAGIVEHHAHTRALDRLGGLRRALPIAFITCVAAALSMAGIPPLLGFVAKESFYAAMLRSLPLADHPVVHPLLISTCILSSALLAAVAWRFTAGVFLGQRPAEITTPARTHDDVHGIPPLWLSPALLASAALALGVLATTTLTHTVVTAASSQPNVDVHVALVPHVGGPLFASIAALVLAGVLYRARHRIGLLRQRRASLPAADKLWERLLDGIVWVAERYSQRWQNGSLRWYLAATLLSVPLFSLYALQRGGLSITGIDLSLGELSWYAVLLCVLLASATIAAVQARTRLGAAIAITTTGFLVSLMFVVYRSPDILLTQILIETVSTIFVVLVLVFFPPFRSSDLSAGARALNMIVAGAFGLTVTFVLLFVMTPGVREIDNIATRPGGLLALSLAVGGGANAVNVIIVDIRAMDTNGEITVLVVVGLCVYGLLRARRRSA